MLVTRGRRTGREHAVALRFAYDNGALWLRTQGRRDPDNFTAAPVVRRGPGTPPDWYLNLQKEPRCRIQVGPLELPGVRESLADPVAALRLVVALWRAKYGAEWVADWYVDVGRVPVKIRVMLGSRT